MTDIYGHLPDAISFIDPNDNTRRKTVDITEIDETPRSVVTHRVNLPNFSAIEVQLFTNPLPKDTTVEELIVRISALQWEDKTPEIELNEILTPEAMASEVALTTDVPINTRKVGLSMFTTYTDGTFSGATFSFELYNQSRVSHDLVMLSKIKGLIENRPDDDIANYEIAGRKVERMRPAELMKWLEFYERRWQQDQDHAALQDGGRNRRVIVPRFRT